MHHRYDKLHMALRTFSEMYELVLNRRVIQKIIVGIDMGPLLGQSGFFVEGVITAQLVGGENLIHGETTLAAEGFFFTLQYRSCTGFPAVVACCFCRSQA